jgi:hypothetical protein
MRKSPKVPNNPDGFLEAPAGRLDAVSSIGKLNRVLYSCGLCGGRSQACEYMEVQMIVCLQAFTSTTSFTLT